MCRGRVSFPVYGSEDESWLTLWWRSYGREVDREVDREVERVEGKAEVAEEGDVEELLGIAIVVCGGMLLRMIVGALV